MESIRSELVEIEYIGEIPGFVSYAQLSSGAERILWILEWAKLKGIKELSPREIEHISRELGIVLTTKNFTSSNRSNFAKRFVSKQGNNFRIQLPGTEYLKSIAKH